MYSIVCVYMHHICIYNVYVYIFLDYFQPLSCFFCFFINIIFDIVFYFEWTYSCNATRCQIVWEFKRIQSSVMFPNFPVDLVAPIHRAGKQDLTPKPKIKLTLFTCISVSWLQVVTSFMHPVPVNVAFMSMMAVIALFLKKEQKPTKKAWIPAFPPVFYFGRKWLECCGLSLDPALTPT